MKVLVTGASGFIGSALCDSLLVRGDTVVGLTRDPEQARRHQPERHLARLGADPGTPAGGGLRGRRRRRQPARREDQPALDRRGQAADHGEPPHRHPQPRRDDRRAGAASRGCWSASRRSASTATAARRSSTSRPSRARASTPRSCASGSRPRARSRQPACASSIVRTGHVLDPRGGLLEQLLTPFKLGVGGPLAGGAPVHVLDPPRRRGRDPALGARQREGQRRRQRDRPQPGHQPRALEGARPGPRPAGGRSRCRASRST